ncbi:MAG: SPFH domain-containing protein [Phycisphaerales bacterium]|nr:SPFH domain-containing protein [Phycisphaerales bacterium]
METREFRGRSVSGWLMLAVLIAGGLGLGAWGYTWIKGAAQTQTASAINVAAWSLAELIWAVLLLGFFTLQPNVGAVLILFGRYMGTVHESGFHWANPFLTKVKVSVRARNLNGERLKVNDSRGNPIEIAAIVVWRVEDTAKAVFDVDHYENYVTIQSEAALRHLAMSYPYDTFEGDTLSLRGSVDEVSAALQKEVQDRVAPSGVVVKETRISHLAYAPEIAGAMLQRQQAEAIVAARTRIVDGAVGMVELALEKLEAKKTVTLDEERRAAMVSNLLVVLCGHESAHPVVNAGTLYTG